MARTLADCLAELARGGEITQSELDRINGEFETRRAQKRLLLGDEEAASQAARELEADMKAAAIEKKRRALLDYAVGQRLKTEAQSFRNASGKPDINEWAMRMFTHVQRRRHAIEGQTRALIAELLDKMRATKLTGRPRNKPLFDEVVRAAHGDTDVSNEARLLADTLAKAFEFLRQRFNDAGGAIGKLENYFPHFHNSQALRQAGQDAWITYILPRLDAEKTGITIAGRPWSTAELEAALPRIYQRIVNEGWNEKEPLMRRAGLGALAGRHAEARSLHFKSGADWLEYDRDFGSGDPFGAMTRHISVMSRDIAAMELLGPNPDGRVSWMRQLLEQQATFASTGRPSLAAKAGEKALKAQRRTDHRVEAMWNYLRGAAEQDVHSGLAEFAGTIRALNVAAKLGTAVISSSGDLGTQKAARLYAGIGGSVVKDVFGYLTTYRMSRDEATRAGLLTDAILVALHDRARFAKAWSIRGVSEQVADRVVALSGLSPWTFAGRHAFGMAFFAEAADYAGKSFAELPQHLRATFERNAITAADWDVIRKAKIWTPRPGMKSGYLRATDVLSLDNDQARPMIQRQLGLAAEDDAANREATRRAIQDIATRYHEMVLNEMEYAVPTASVRARTLIAANTRPGTPEGEIIRSLAQFRMYPLVYMTLWGARILDEMRGGHYGRAAGIAAGGALRGATWAAGLTATMTAFGALTLQLKNMAAGRDLQDMDDWHFWAASLATGGGLGILGDFLFADFSRYGHSLQATVLGPSFELFADLYNLKDAAYKAIAEGNASPLGRQITQIFKNNTPGGNIWYLRAGAQRLLFDNLQRVLDPKADRAFHRQVRNSLRERNQGFWWAPGESAPDHFPTYGAQ